MELTISVAIGFMLDCILGDPHRFPHPVRFMGMYISVCVRLFNSEKRSNAARFILGALTSVILVAAGFLIPFLVLKFAGGLSGTLRIALESVMCYQALAARSLFDESMKVCRALEENDIKKARYNVSMIVGRDTENLGAEKIARAAVETVAENLTDGVIAPLIFMFIGGAPLALAYKAVNTLDSMIGYKNEKYEFFGKFAARLDDAVNFIPARAAAVLMLAATVFCRLDTKNAFKIYARDRYNHKSPNSAQTEAVCAGALGISLSGDNYYGGVLVHKPSIGDAGRRVVSADIRLANRLMYASVILGLITGIIIRLIII